MTYTADDLIKSVKRGITIPNFQALMGDDDLLALADEETLSLILPIILSLRLEYFVVKESVPIVNSQEAYDIPYRSVGRGLRDLLYTVDGVDRNIAYIEPEDTHYYSNNNTASDPRGFTFRGDKIILVPSASNTSAFLTLTYHARPNKLVQTTKAARVVFVNTVTKEVTVNMVPTSISIGSQVDLLQGKQGCSMIDFDVNVTNIVGNVMTLSSVLTLTKGDWISLAETSPVLQTPEECMQVIAQAVQCRVLEAQGDTDGYNISKARLDEKIRQIKDLLTPRIEGEERKIVNRNGLLRRRNFQRNTKRYV